MFKGICLGSKFSEACLQAQGHGRGFGYKNGSEWFKLAAEAKTRDPPKATQVHEVPEEVSV